MRLALLLLLVAACGARHVTLRTPEPEQHFPYRVAQFQQIGPANTAHYLSLGCSGFGCQFKHTGRTMFLGDGQKVTTPSDLLAVVPANSPTAYYARETDRFRLHQKVWGFLGLGTAITGGAVWYVSRSDDVIGRNGSETGRVIGYGLGVGGLVMALVGAWAYEAKADRATERAFAHYAEDLATTLRICVSGFTLYPCESTPQDKDAVQLQVTDR